MDDIREIGITTNPLMYRKYQEISKKFDTEANREMLNKILASTVDNLRMLQGHEFKIRESIDGFLEEIKQTTKLKLNALSDQEEVGDAYGQLEAEAFNFIVIIHTTVANIVNTYSHIYNTAKGMVPPNTVPFKDMGVEAMTVDFNSMQMMSMQMGMNGRMVEKHVSSVFAAYTDVNYAIGLLRNLLPMFEKYYQMLIHRHSVEDVHIARNAAITDVATKIFNNIDAHGEVETGKDENQISAFTMRKAEILASVAKNDMVMTFMKDLKEFYGFIEVHTRNVTEAWKMMSSIAAEVGELIADEINIVVEPEDGAYMPLLSRLKDTNPATVAYVESKKIYTEDVKMMKALHNDTVKEIVNRLLDPRQDFKELVKYVISRKIELRKFYHDENSFYTCKIGGGNPFTGQAPGALQVIPAPRPKADMNFILGTGFDEIREFVGTVEAAEKWHNLFVATSPSKTADKSNVLMIGPPGCGKTQVLRAVGGDTKSIGVFATGSDFETCWKGEAEKNPKRMFEAGLKLNKESGKHVHFLIDEIDSFLNDDVDINGGGNLTLEFQNLMDGVVSYPNLSIWGATNHPERIPPAMMRRFSKVLIVGELDQKDRIKLLKHYIGFLPLADISDDQWDNWATQLDGATGDVIRKVADDLWRNSITRFVKDKPEKAEEILKALEGEVKFDVLKFDRAAFKEKLKHHVLITSIDISRSLTNCLSNVGINKEITVAKKTYEAARALLQQIKN